MNILNNLEKWVTYCIYGVFILTFINTCNSCSNSRNQVKLKKEIINQQKEIDSLSKEIINEKKMEKILEDYMWEFLIIEELSDKQHIPINEFRVRKNKEQNEIK